MPPRKTPATPAHILNAAADHIERVGLYQGEHLWQPGKMGDTAPCNVLHAWDQGVSAARPHRSVPAGLAWDIFHSALRDSLIMASDHVAGGPIPPARWQALEMVEWAYRRTTLWSWGDEPGRTAVEAAAMFRAVAAPVTSDRDHIWRS
ncbi:hypothetical protein C9F11_20935 [Streptomyces sp. YIM 121038]|uniref:DUF6197 family protein n=1 Tax=Streptomyces sp. YIM 121038 TaxID=2136401 RepID=UPI00111003E1|nr:DUF6197 family protein [Streptomyces sp. YIM 121038]QCX77819.1 hypothetical protein C9F11_20935 [Streptomyces sp. YIM 121038]